MDTLCELASVPGEVIPRFDLIKRVWKVDYGADESLTRAISVLRKTFKSGGATEKYIETISKNGYRLIAPVTPWEDDGSRAVPIGRRQQQELLRAPAETVTSTDVPVRAAPPKDSPINVPQVTAEGQALRTELTKSPPAAAPHMAQAKTNRAGAVIIGLLGLAFVSGVFGYRYTEGVFDDYKSEITELRDLSQVDAGALDKIDPIVVREPFRGDVVNNTANDYGRSVAVMPFTDMSPLSDQQHLADGMAEEVLLELSEISGLRIVGRGASFGFKNDGTDMRRVGETLKVSHVIDGSIRTQNDQVRISAQLIDTANQSQIWGQSYDGQLKDGLNLQSQIARDIVAELTLTLSLGLEDPIVINLDGFQLPQEESRLLSTDPLSEVKSARSSRPLEAALKQMEAENMELSVMLQDLDFVLSGELDSPVPQYNDFMKPERRPR